MLQIVFFPYRNSIGKLLSALEFQKCRNFENESVFPPPIINIVSISRIYIYKLLNAFPGEIPRVYTIHDILYLYLLLLLFAIGYLHSSSPTRIRIKWTVYRFTTTSENIITLFFFFLPVTENLYIYIHI